ncbi:MAG: dehydrogenase [Hyphomicrobiales bacterium]|nr:MAG: dehydrogenase [Hyphomicrobiales bacterium]
MGLQGKVAVITGGAQGIGLACAQRMAADGAKVIVADRNEKAGVQAESDLIDAGFEARFVHCDVSERLEVCNMIKTAVETFGSVDILINNAEVVHAADFLDLEEEDFDRVLRINLKGSFLTGKMAAKQMVRQIEAGGEPGVIINMSSVNAVFALTNQVPYTVSKGGLNQLTKVMSLSLAPYGIRVNGIGPGSIATRMLDSVDNDAEAERQMLSRTPLGRIGKPEEIAGIAAFLVSDDASYVTGQTIYADGGRLGLNTTVPVAD